MSAAWILALVFLTALIGGYGSASAGEFYDSLAKPAWAPPKQLFGPVWTVLYICIATAGVLYLRSGGEGKMVGLTIYASQLVLNGAWSWFFFAWRQGGLALLVILALLVSILGFCWIARHTSPLAAWLFVPYAAWVTFALALSASVWLRNPEAL